MAEEVVNSYNFYIDTERYIPSGQKGDNTSFSLNQTPITCAANQFIRLTLQSFSMYKSFTNVNPNNNILRLAGTSGAGAISAIVPLTCQDYPVGNDLANEFATKLADALATATGVALAAIPIPANQLFPQTTGPTDNIISFRIDFAAPHGITNLLIQTFVSDGDCFELLGTDRLYDGDVTGQSVASVDLAPASAPTPANSLIVQCKYNLQLSTQQNVYLRTNLTNTNIQTESYSAGSTDVKNQSQMASSDILGRMIVDNEFINYTTGTQLEYFVNLSARSLQFMKLFLTDSHSRIIPNNVKYLETPVGSINTPAYTDNQATLGSRSWEGVIKIDIVQFMGGQNNVLQSELPVNTIPARFESFPLKHLDYGASGYPDVSYDLKNRMKKL